MAQNALLNVNLRSLVVLKFFNRMLKSTFNFRRLDWFEFKNRTAA